MARITLTVGELTIDVQDRLPWLSRRSMAAVEFLLGHFLDKDDYEQQELTTITELQADDEDELDYDDDEGDELPGIGFRSKPH